MDNIDLFFDTFYERQQIWYKRNILKQERPWTSNEIFQEHKFTNSYRELDRNSQYLIKTTLSNDKIELEDIVLRVLLFRIYNKIEFFDLIEFEQLTFEDFDLKYFQKQIEYLERENNFQTANTHSYLVNTWLCKGLPAGLAYAERIVPSILQNIEKIYSFIQLCNYKDINKLIKCLKEINGIGNFISYEYFLDFCYLSKYNQKHKVLFSEDDYLNVGPGAIQGLQYLVGEKYPKRQEKDLCWLLLSYSREILIEKEFKFVKWNINKSKYELCEFNLTIHNIEFWLCEFSKYMKLLTGKRRKNTKFIPHE